MYSVLSRWSVVSCVKSRLVPSCHLSAVLGQQSDSHHTQDEQLQVCAPHTLTEVSPVWAGKLRRLRWEVTRGWTGNTPGRAGKLPEVGLGPRLAGKLPVVGLGIPQVGWKVTRGSARSQVEMGSYPRLGWEYPRLAGKLPEVGLGIPQVGW